MTDRLVPEGFADIHLEGPDQVHFEVKSRQGRRGPFRVGEAARHIADALINHLVGFESSTRLVVVLEQNVKGCRSGSDSFGSEISLSNLVDEVIELGRSIRDRIESDDRTTKSFEDLAANASIMICPWDWLLSNTESEIRSLRQLPAAAIKLVARNLQSEIAGAVDKNAESMYENRVGVDRTMLVNTINSSAELIDLESIEYALSAGICSTMDMTPSETGDAYYEGVSTQPGHVGADLVVPRPDLVTQVLNGLDAGKATLLEGPSGIGKSAVLWTVPMADPGVLWFRVNQVSDEDVPHIVRLLKAHNPSPDAPVGILVDGVGNAATLGWFRLRQAVDAIPGVLLVGTVRSEDIFVLGDLADCATVHVSLNEQSAEAIYDGLVRRGKTSAVHWREAFEECDGLTLEFTHKLTQGTRLSDVISDQINKRVNEKRVDELEVLARVAVADRWSASIETEILREVLNIDKWDLRLALNRLNQEHLLIETEGSIKGVHQIRSTAIVDAIHAQPQPDLVSTVLDVLRILRGTSLTRFVFEFLKERPDLSKPILRELKQISDDDVESLVASLRGLELFDFLNQSVRWLDIARGHNVSPAHLPLVYMYAIGGIDCPDGSRDEIRRAVADMASLDIVTSTRETLISQIGVGKIASKLVNARDVDQILRLLRALIRIEVDWGDLISSVKAATNFRDALQLCLIADFADCVALAHLVSRELADTFVDVVGGSEPVLDRIRTEDPWIHELKIVSYDGEGIGFARFLHVSDVDQGSPRDRSIMIGRLLLRTLPSISKVDVQAVLPGGHKSEIDGYDHTASGLLRKYDHHPLITRMNQERVCLAHLHFGTSETERIAKFSQLLPKCASLVNDFGTMFARRDAARSEIARLEKRRHELIQEANDIAPGVGPDPLDDEFEIEVGDPLSALILDVCGNALPRFSRPSGYRALSVFVNQTLIGKDIPAIKLEPWWLIGRDCPEAELDELSDLLADLDAMIIELSSNPDSLAEMSEVAKNVPRIRALKSTAAFSRDKTGRRIERHRREVVDALVSTGLPLRVYWYDGDPLNGKLPNFAVAVELETVTDWGSVIEELLPTLDACQVVGESPLLVPMINGEAVKLLARRYVNSKIWPDAKGNEFDEQQPPSLAQRLTTHVVAANSALASYSGLSIISEKIEDYDQLANMRQRTTKAYDSAIAEIRRLPQDELTEFFLSWFDASATLVEGEWLGNIEAGTFAANAVEGELGLNLDQRESLMGMLMLALEWDSDPAKALQLLTPQAD